MNRACGSYDDEFCLGDAGVFLNELSKNGFRVVKKSPSDRATS